MTAQIASARMRVFALLLAGLAVYLEGGPAWAAPPGSPWGADYFPNVELVTQDGDKVHFYDLIKDKVVAVNFIYTRCTDSCPAETAALRKVQKALGERMGRDVFFYSISIDGKTDQPAELKTYAAKFKAGPGWTFLTGRKQDVMLIRRKLGLYRDDGKAEKQLSEHNINILMGNEKTGQWIKRSPFEETDALVRILTTRLQPTTRRADQPAAARVADAAPGMATPGGKLFRSQCANCHSLGTDSDLGPGLADVTRKRDRAWLKRWLKAPDALIRDKDPIALALFRQYKEIYMPNLKLSDGEIEDLLQFLESASPAAPAASTP